MPTYAAILDAEVAPEAPVTTSLLTRLRDNALAYAGAPSGTVALWRQTSAPLGWTKGSTHNDKGLRLTTGTVGSSGSVAYSTLHARTSTDNFTIAQGNLPSYTLPDTLGISDTRTWGTSLTYYAANGVGPFGLPGGAIAAFAAAAAVVVTGGSISKTGSVTSGGSGTPMPAGIDMRVSTVDVIEATKD